MRRIGGALLALVALTACTDDEDPADSVDTLGSLVVPTGESVLADTASPEDTSLATGAEGSGQVAAAGSGVVQIEVRVADTGQRDTLVLDRSTVAADELDPISLFAACSGLDGGPGYVVEVTDLRRLTTGSEFVSARLSVDEDVVARGIYEVTLDLSDADQTATSYTGTITIEPGLRDGTFDVTDDQGRAATGSFRCTDEAVAEAPPTTRPARLTPPGTEEVGPGPTTVPSTAPPTTS